MDGARGCLTELVFVPFCSSQGAIFIRQKQPALRGGYRTGCSQVEICSGYRQEASSRRADLARILPQLCGQRALK